MDEKQCPLNCRTDFHHECTREKCAWWVVDAQSCAVAVIAREMRKKK